MDNNDGRDIGEAETEIFPMHYNYYLAIMAVSCYQNEYLLYLLQEQFLLSGGPLEWLIFGLEKVDAKLRRVAELNEILAYKPWSLKDEHLTYLIKEGD